MHSHNSFLPGIYTALVTPFTTSGAIDQATFEKLVAAQINAGVTGIVLLGTTSEWITLSKEERIWLVQTAISLSHNSIKLVVGIGTASTAETIENGRIYADLGADSFMTVTPYYNSPSQLGLYEHFASVAQSISPLPMMMYNVPHRTGVDMLPDTTIKLAKIPNIAAIKDAASDSNRCSKIVDSPLIDQSFKVFSGNDTSFLQYMQQGGDGLVSVIGNIAPELLQNIYIKISQKNENENANQELLFFLDKLLALINQIPNPSGVKFAMSLTGLLRNKLRLPQTPFDTNINDNQQLSNQIKQIVTSPLCK